MNRACTKRARVGKALAFCFFAAFLLPACATYQGKVQEARDNLQQNPVKAAEGLEKLALEEGKDQLAYLLDYATALQSAGNYAKSSKYFLIADQMAELKDYHSVSKLGASLLLNQEQVQYKGDDYEKVLISAMLAINFLMEGKLDDALVETKRINEKLDYYRLEEKKKYEQNQFALYLGAMIWEADRKWDDAYIAFNNTYKRDPSIPYLRDDLPRSATRAQRRRTANKWKREFSVKPKPEWDDRKFGEVVLIYLQGWGPRKGPRIGAPRFPQLFPVRSETQSARLELLGKKKAKESSQQVYSVQDVAIRTLNDHYGSLVVKRVAGVVAKEVVADQVRQENEALGALVQIGMHLSDRADLRQWSTLPQTFQVSKLRVAQGNYTARAVGLNSAGYPTGERMADKPITVRAGKKTFLLWRSYQ